MNKTAFSTLEHERALNLFSTKHRVGFTSKTVFASWFTLRLQQQDFCCYYCETSILDIRSLISQGLLKTRATGYGQRGPVLEIDKKENHLGYNQDNCVLSCYYCNNDKSYTLDSAAYKQYFGPNRKLFFEYFNVLPIVRTKMLGF
jgi:hypothetical protein